MCSTFGMHTLNEDTETTRIAEPGSAAAPLPFQVAGYQIGDFLGSGSMGNVHVAVDALTGEVGAAKIVSLLEPLQHARFERTVAVREEVSHPAILPLWAHEQTSTYGVLVSPLLQPESLREAIPRDGFEFDAVADLLGPIAGALDALHRSDWVHRDVKPDNILLGGDQPYLVDYGLAKRHRSRLEDSGAFALAMNEETRPNAVCGSPLYMSGQRLQGKPARPGDDVYALALSLVELLMGSVPGSSLGQTFLGLAQARVDCYVHLGPLPCPSALRKLLLAALGPRNRNRPSAGDFEALLS